MDRETFDRNVEALGYQGIPDSVEVRGGLILPMPGTVLYLRKRWSDDLTLAQCWMMNDEDDPEVLDLLYERIEEAERRHFGR